METKVTRFHLKVGHRSWIKSVRILNEQFSEVIKESLPRGEEQVTVELDVMIEPLPAEVYKALSECYRDCWPLLEAALERISLVQVIMEGGA